MNNINRTLNNDVRIVSVPKCIKPQAQRHGKGDKRLIAARSLLRIPCKSKTPLVLAGIPPTIPEDRGTAGSQTRKYSRNRGASL